MGVNINFFSLSNQGLNFFQDCKSLLDIYKIIKNVKPNIIISYTVKPVIYTGLVLKCFKKVSYFPLITGLAQVNPDPSGAKSWKKSIKLDIYYSSNISFYLDMQIFFKTLILVIFKKKQYNDFKKFYQK